MTDIPIQRTILVGEPAPQARERFMQIFTPWMGSGGYKVSVQPTSVGYVRRSFHTWQIVVAIFFFPFGLIGLLAERQEHRLDAQFTDDGGGATAIMLTGSIPSSSTGQIADEIDAFDPAVESTPDGRNRELRLPL